MKKIIVILFILSFAAPCFASTVGSPEISIPEESLYLKNSAVNKTLDRYEYNTDIKGALEIEVVTKKKLTSAPADTTDAELKGQSYMFKFSNNFYNSFEPYIKVGTSNLEVKWKQHNNDIRVETDHGFTWGAGVKAKLWEFKDYGVKLTLDLQYRNLDIDVDEATIGGSTATAAAINKKFEIKEWQTSLLASKKFIVPIGKNDYYLVPYTGLTFSSMDVDVYFTQSTTGALYSTYNASDDKIFGMVLGCDIMPFFLSYYLLNFELRLINETAITLGGTVKF